MDEDQNPGPPAAAARPGTAPGTAAPRASSQPVASLTNLGDPPALRGCIDRFEDGVIRGWALETGNPMRPVPLEIRLAGVRIASITTQSPRGDLAKLVGHPVRAGFMLDIATVPGADARQALARLSAIESPSVPLDDLLSVTVAGQTAKLPLSSRIRKDRAEIAPVSEALARAATRISESDRIQRRDHLLAMPLAGVPAPVSVLAYYLPQFHPFAENDEWWGPGFTEWTNVAGAKPLFVGHDQPHLPADMGFYDLRLDQVQRDQIALARRYGIAGFCYYYYWFAGKTLMTMPIDRHVAQDLDLDFCLCWANESWSRRWDGSETDVLMTQPHSHDGDIDFIRACLPYFRSPRYIRIDGAPFLQVYRIALMDRPRETVARWREIVRAEGFPDLHVCMVESFGLSDPHEYGCDSSCQFPPHGTARTRIEPEIEGLEPGYSGRIYSYETVVRNELARPAPPHLRFRTAMPAWDNTPRKGAAGNVFAGASPPLFEIWMRHLVADACNRLPEDRRLVFVNAWNEWAEGAHLEPDRRYGHANLRAVRDALMPESVALAPLVPPPDGQDDPLAETRRHVESLIRANRELVGLIRRDGFDLRLGEEQGFVPCPASLVTVEAATGGKFRIEQVNGIEIAPGGPVLIPADRALSLRGWFALPGRGTHPGLVALRDTVQEDAPRQIAAIHHRIRREDAVHAHALGESALDCGFSFAAALAGIPPGRYEIELLCPDIASTSGALAIPTAVQLLIG